MTQIMSGSFIRTAVSKSMALDPQHDSKRNTPKSKSGVSNDRDDSFRWITKLS
jgi:hypothetical protein